MNRKYRLYTVAVLLLLSVVFWGISCEKAFPDDSLDNYWRLDRIEYKSGLNRFGEPCQAEDVDNIMFGFARHIVMIEYPGLLEQHGATTRLGDSIRLDYSMYDNPGLINTLRRCGLDSVVTVFKIEYPDRQRMVLSSSKTVLRFRKW